MLIEFVCGNQEIINDYPVKPASKIIPDWYKNLDLRAVDSSLGLDLPTIKKCLPVQDLLLAGYIISNNVDITLTPKERFGYSDFQYECEYQQFVGAMHHVQCPVHINDQAKNYFKIAQPWIIKTPPGYSCLVLQPFYHFEQRFTLLPAIIDTDHLDQPMELPGWIDSNHSITIEKGTPLAQIIPFKRDVWSMKMSAKEPQRSLLADLETDRYRQLFHQKKTFR